MLGGEVEIEQTFIGGKTLNMHSAKHKAKMQDRGASEETVVMGMLERGGKVKTRVVENRNVENRNKETLHAHINEHVTAGANVFTDELVAYWGLDENFIYRIINHAEQYVQGKIHTNGLEEFRRLLKRGLNRTYVSVEPFHVFRYIDEQAFRYNNRKDMTDADRFDLAVLQAIGKRLTWGELTRKAPTQPEAF